MNPFFAEVLVGIERKLVEAGFITLMAHTHESVELQTKLMQSMREQNAAGMILCPALGTPATLVKEVQAWGIPLIVMVRSLGKGSYDYAGSDNALGTFMATNHLLEKGHRRIGFLGGRSGAVFDDRLQGYRAAMKKHRLKEHPELLCPALPTRQGGYDALQKLLDVEPRATAAVCYNDITAFGALAALGERGITVGRDFAVMGFDGLLDTAHSNPPLSTVDVRPGALGEAAASLMLERLSRPDTARLRYVATPELRLRASA
jgi:LacI family transcriptional regulator